MTEFGEREVIGRIPLAGTTELRVSKSSKDGKPCVDIRTFFANLDKIDIKEFAEKRPAEVFNPSKKGIFLEVPQFVELMDKFLIPLHKEVTKK